MPIEEKLLEILACPSCKTKVVYEEGKLVCVHCGRRYPVEDDIPIMLLDRAEPPPAGWEARE